MLKECITKYKKMVTLYLVNGLVQTIISALVVVCFQQLIDSLGKTGDISNAMRYLCMFGLLQILEYILGYIENYPSSILNNSFYYQLKLNALKKISKIDFLQYKQYGTGEIIQLVENGVDAGRKILFSFYLNVFRNIIPGVLVSMVLIGIYDFKIMVAIAISYGFVFLITKILLKKLYLVKNSTLMNEEKFTSKLVRAFMEMVVFRINRKYKTEIKECEDTSIRIVKSKTKILMTHEMFFTSFAFIVAIIKIIAIFIGINQIIAGTSSIGIIVALVTLIDRVYTPIAIFNVVYIDYTLNKIAFKRYENPIDQPDDEMIGTGEVATIKEGNISLENLSFQYGQNVVLDNMSFMFENGKAYAIVGQSGVGKTTILGLISGLLKANSGKIFIDHQDLTKMNLNTYYKHIAYLSQDPAIFDGTIRENLVFDKKVDDQVLWSALKDVNLYDQIKSKKSKLDEPIGEKGSMLSGGEKQRLALARIIISQPKIVIVDEATSAIDNINESIILKNVLNTLSDSTVIAVTHKVHTTYMFDQILLLDNGHLRDTGTMKQLLNKDILFKKLYEREKI
ncbi:MAG: ABC transporter ATP-binding protein [Clostridiales bacterium]|nr:ABC transporter ATP-binding protein [Clostridiales bacterium]